MAESKDFVLISLVAIVAIVGMVVLFMNASPMRAIAPSNGLVVPQTDVNTAGNAMYGVKKPSYSLDPEPDPITIKLSDSVLGKRVKLDIRDYSACKAYQSRNPGTSVEFDPSNSLSPTGIGECYAIY